MVEWSRHTHFQDAAEPPILSRVGQEDYKARAVNHAKNSGQPPSYCVLTGVVYYVINGFPMAHSQHI